MKGTSEEACEHSKKEAMRRNAIRGLEIGSAIDTRRERQQRERNEEREREGESMRKVEREEISWECYFDVCVVYYKVVILQILQPLGFVS